ncbi:hypothetical protein K3724_08625 [Leisingera sp. M658]|nr:hypothetical protein K3724_08625 [Leisingera sp. M658]
MAVEISGPKPGIELGNLCLHPGQGRDQHLECGDRTSWQTAFRGIGGIVLLLLDEGFDICRRDQACIVAWHADPAAQVMRATAVSHLENIGQQLAEEGLHLTPPQLLARNRLFRSICLSGLKHILGQIEFDRINLRRDRSPLWIVADPPWHIGAVGSCCISKAGTKKRKIRFELLLARFSTAFAQPLAD